MIKAGIIGGAGYTAGELLRILLCHPQVEVDFVLSQSQVGKAIHEVHCDLLGETDLIFSKAMNSNVDVLFFCMGHGKSKEFLDTHTIPKHIRIIDLSSDFRLKKAGNPFVYGLPELNKEQIKASHYIANCGCFATAIQLALLPLAKAGLIKNAVHVHAVTGSTGAGQQPQSTTHFSWRNNNLSVYKPFQHQHLAEIYQSVKQLQNDFKSEINFIPVRGDFPRGIFASLYMETPAKEVLLKDCFNNYYKKEPFVVISDQNPNLKQVVNTNKCCLYLQKIDNKLLIISILDNLLKGASGQAVQNMNLMFGFDEKAGLSLKATVF